MNAAHQPVVQWLPELAPSLEARAAALTMYETQTGALPPAVYLNLAQRIWGCIGPDAVLLFRIPDAWEPEGTLAKVEPTSGTAAQTNAAMLHSLAAGTLARPPSSSARTHHRVTS